LILAVLMLALAGFVALGPPALTAWARGRWLISVLATAAAAGAIYDALRGSWLGATILLAAAVWIGTDIKRPAAPLDPGMSRSEAASMLGVDEAASREEIEAAFRRLMRRVHPDHGGAPGLAAQLNAARALLLGRR
jgi:hypothetical protein